MRKRRDFREEKERVVVDRDRARAKTFERAARLLAAKPRSVRELQERLLEKPWTDSEIVDAVIARLREYGYLDDDQYARDVALSKLRQKPQGRRRLQYAMSQKKLEKTVVDAAIANAFETTPERGLIDLAIEKRLRSKGIPKSRDEMKRLIDHLLRRGFSYDLIREKTVDIQKLRTDDDA